jgi:capsular exopolysaccharide synthesis family protein
LTTSPTPLALILALRRRWKTTAAVGLVLAALGAALAYLLVPASKYTARATLKVNSNYIGLLPDSRDSQAQFQIYQQSQIAMIKSRLVLQTTLKKPEVAELSIVRQHPEDARIDWLEKELQVDFPQGSEIMRIALNGDQADELRTLVKAVKDTYLTEVVNKEKIEKEERRQKLVDIFKNYQESLAGQRAQILKLAQSVRTRDTALAAKIAQLQLERLQAVQRDWLANQSALRDAENELEVVTSKEKTLADAKVPDYQIEDIVQVDPEYQRFLSDIALVQLEMSSYDADFLPAAAARYKKESEKKLEAIRKSMAAYRDKKRPMVEVQLRQKLVGEFHKSLTALEEKVKKLRSLDKELGELVRKLTKETESMQEATLDLETNKLAIEKEENAAKRIGEQIETLSIELQAPERITQFEEASVAPANGGQKRILAAGLSFCGVFLLSLFGAAWLEHTSRRIYSPEQITQGLGLKVTGTLPDVSARVCQTLALASPSPAEMVQQSLLDEAMDAARSMILHESRAAGLRSVMVTSAMSGEGKTTLATRLAASLARGGVRTLLIDGDLRNPKAHRVLGRAQTPGLAEVLRGEVDAEHAVQAGAVANLALLAAGKCDPHSIQALAGSRLGDLLHQMEDQYEFIVVDSCPVLAVADTLSIGLHVKGVLLATLAEVSQLRKVHQAAQRLAAFELQVLGTVVNGVREETYDSAYIYAGKMRA